MVNLINELRKILKVASARGKYEAKQEAPKGQIRAGEGCEEGRVVLKSNF